MEGVHLLYLGGAIVGLYQNGGCDEQRNEHIDTRNGENGGVNRLFGFINIAKLTFDVFLLIRRNAM